jgi:hypothetical protein
VILEVDPRRVFRIERVPAGSATFKESRRCLLLPRTIVDGSRFCESRRVMTDRAAVDEKKKSQQKPHQPAKANPMRTRL